MNRAIYKGVATLLLACLVAVPAMAEVYKWTDAQGRVHYGDKPPPTGATELQLPADGDAPGEVPDQAQRRENTRRLLRAFDEERRLKQQQERQQQAQESKRVRRCAAARDRLQRYRNARALYDFDEQGKRLFLNEQQRQQAEAKAAREVQRWCDS